MTKRSLDIMISALGLLLASPVLLVVVLLIWLQDRRAPFYIASRIGKDGRPFEMIKLRSMVVDSDATGVCSTGLNDPRVTRIGQFIRATKLDEFSQLWNVLKGDMSIVGPRPNTWRRGVELYTEEERHLLSVRPGITDLSSIVFSDEGDILKHSADPDADYDRLIRPWKSELALFYIRHQSMRLDIELIWLTVVAIAARRHALIGVQRVLGKLNARKELVELTSRTNPLRPAVPPGASGPVAKYTDETNQSSSFVV